MSCVYFSRVIWYYFSHHVLVVWPFFYSTRLLISAFLLCFSILFAVYNGLLRKPHGRLITHLHSCPLFSTGRPGLPLLPFNFYPTSLISLQLLGHGVICSSWPLEYRLQELETVPPAPCFHSQGDLDLSEQQQTLYWVDRCMLSRCSATHFVLRWLKLTYDSEVTLGDGKTSLWITHNWRTGGDK